MYIFSLTVNCNANSNKISNIQIISPTNMRPALIQTCIILSKRGLGGNSFGVSISTYENTSN